MSVGDVPTRNSVTKADGRELSTDSKCCSEAATPLVDPGNEHDQTNRHGCSFIPSAHLHAGLPLAPGLVQGLLRDARNVSARRDHPLRLSFDVDSSRALRLDLRASLLDAFWA